jgi:predicted nucleotide-binding protein
LAQLSLRGNNQGNKPQNSSSMARKPTPPPQDLSLSGEQIKQGIERLRRRIGDLEAFEPTTVKERWAPETKAIEASIDDALSRIFGHNTPRYSRYEPASRLDHGALIFGGGPDPLYKVHEWLAEGKTSALALLGEAVKSLEEDLSDLGESAAAETPPPTVHPVPVNDIFVIHGHDS